MKEKQKYLFKAQYKSDLGICSFEVFRDYDHILTSEEEKEEAVRVNTSNTALAESLATYLGGADNVVEVDNCTTRLRLKVKDSDKIQDAEIKKLVPGLLKPSKEAVQVIIGPHVEFVATELKRILNK